MLRSSEHIYLKIEKPPDVSELDHRHKQQMKLLLLCRRSVALYRIINHIKSIIDLILS